VADINGITLQAGSSPTVHYTITYTKSRLNNSQMRYNFTISAALSSSGSFIRSGYALLCTMTVNGSSSQVRIKAADGDNWEGTTPRLRYVSVTALLLQVMQPSQSHSKWYLMADCRYPLV